MSFDYAAMRAELERDEGSRGKPYDDATGEPIKAPIGHVTIGLGWNLDAAPLPDEIIDRLADIAIEGCLHNLDAFEPRWRNLDPDRQRVLVGLVYNLGLLRLVAFTRFWRELRGYLSTGDEVALDRAAAELLDSAAARQLPARYGRWAARMESGHQLGG